MAATLIECFLETSKKSDRPRPKRRRDRDTEKSGISTEIFSLSSEEHIELLKLYLDRTPSERRVFMQQLIDQAPVEHHNNYRNFFSENI
jgi:hypothetical protein